MEWAATKGNSSQHPWHTPLCQMLAKEIPAPSFFFLSPWIQTLRVTTCSVYWLWSLNWRRTVCDIGVILDNTPSLEQHLQQKNKTTKTKLKFAESVPSVIICRSMWHLSFYVWTMLTPLSPDFQQISLTTSKELKKTMQPFLFFSLKHMTMFLLFLSPCTGFLFEKRIDYKHFCPCFFVITNTNTEYLADFWHVCVPSCHLLSFFFWWWDFQT